MNYVNEFNYQFYLMEEMQNSKELERAINEATMLEGGVGTYNRFVALSEAGVDSIKSGVQKLMDFVKKIFAKFLETMDTIIKSDVKYLEKYKDIILKRAPKEYDVDMYDYVKGTKLIMTKNIPPFNHAMIETDLQSRDVFIAKHFKEFVTGNAPYENFADQVKEKFRGEEVTIESKDVNFTDMYNYCFNYKKMKEVMEKDITFLNKAADEIIKEVEKKAKAGEISSSNEFAEVGKRDMYSVLYESFLNEDGTQPNAGAQQQAPKPAATTPQAGSKSNEDNAPKGGSTRTEPKDNNQSSTSDKPEEKKPENKTIEKSYTDGMNVYVKVCGEYIGAKMTIAEEAYKAFMSVIKAHVRDFVGNADNDNQTGVAKVGTNPGYKSAKSQQNKENEKNKDKK